MFNKVEKRAIKKQMELLQDYLNAYGDMLESCNNFFYAYNKLDLYEMALYAGNINFILKYANIIKQITELEKIITGKFVECDKSSFKLFITGMTDYILFHEFKNQKNGNIINTGKSYKKIFKGLERRDVQAGYVKLTFDAVKEK